MRTDRFGVILSLAVMALALGCGDEQDKTSKNACTVGEPSTCMSADFMQICVGGSYSLVNCMNGCDAATGLCITADVGKCVGVTCPSGQECSLATGTCMAVSGCGSACPIGYKCVSQPTTMCVPDKCLNDNACPAGFI